MLDQTTDGITECSTELECLQLMTVDIEIIRQLERHQQMFSYGLSVVIAFAGIAYLFRFLLQTFTDTNSRW
jgi:hypothetical protein